MLAGPSAFPLGASPRSVQERVQACVVAQTLERNDRRGVCPRVAAVASATRPHPTVAPACSRTVAIGRGEAHRFVQRHPDPARQGDHGHRLDDALRGHHVEQCAVQSLGNAAAPRVAMYVDRGFRDPVVGGALTEAAGVRGWRTRRPALRRMLPRPAKGNVASGCGYARASRRPRATRSRTWPFPCLPMALRSHGW